MPENQAILHSGPDQADAERRCGHDRRRHSWRTLTYCGLNGRGRRRQVRRQQDNYYLDWYSPALVLCGLGVLLLSSMDALLTLTLLDLGAYEANLVMAHALDMGPRVFAAVKIAITGAGVLFLMMHAHFRILGLTSGRQMLKLLLGLYVLLVLYELAMWGTIS